MSERFGAGELFQGVVLLGGLCGLCTLVPLLGFLIFGFGIWAVPYGIVRCSIQTARGKPDPSRTAWWWARGLVVGVLAIAGSLTAMGQRIKDCETRAAPVIAALERHRDETGTYPQKLIAMKAYASTGLPDGVSDDFGFESIVYQHYRKGAGDREGYSLTYFPVAGLPLRHSYGPESRKWMTWD